jgi:hypothetical protein
MRRPRGKPSATLIDQMLGEASWLLSHAQALGDYRRPEEAAAELERAAGCEEQVACLLEADGQEREAAIHRVSAASCREQLGQYVRAVTLLHAALSTELPSAYRTRLREQLTSCLAHAQKELVQAARRVSRKQSSAVS